MDHSQQARLIICRYHNIWGQPTSTPIIATPIIGTVSFALPAGIGLKSSSSQAEVSRVGQYLLKFRDEPDE